MCKMYQNVQRQKQHDICMKQHETTWNNALEGFTGPSPHSKNIVTKRSEGCARTLDHT
jgi:hypothetical protein